VRACVCVCVCVPCGVWCSVLSRVQYFSVPTKRARGAVARVVWARAFLDVLLRWTYPDRPRGWLVNEDVLIKHVCDAGTAWRRAGSELDVHALVRVVHVLRINPRRRRGAGAGARCQGLSQRCGARVAAAAAPRRATLLVKHVDPNRAGPRCTATWIHDGHSLARIRAWLPAIRGRPRRGL